MNPKQFGPNEDYGRYPRTLPSDCQLLDALRIPELYVFTPSADEMYPPSFDAAVHIGGAAVHSLEAKSRPGHFDGVCTVVLKLLNLVRPTVMYLGQKDAVQCLVLQKLARDLCVPSMVEVLPTVRESDGLAMSSRNRYLSPEERQRAAVVPASLFAAQAAFNGGQLKRTALFDVATRKLKEQPALEVQYISLMDAEGVEQDEAKPGMILSFAGKLGSTRLIDAIKL